MAKLRKKINKFVKINFTAGEPDYVLVSAIFIIIIFGLIMLSSASSAVAYARFGSTYYYLNHQLAGLLIGLAAFLFFSKMDYHVWKNYAFWFLVFSILLLSLVFIPGLSANYGKARSWINIFGYSLQPSELVKISFLLYLAAWLESRSKMLHDFYQGTGPFVAVLSVIGLLMVLQPDIGTLSIITLTSLIVYFAGGGAIRHILAIMIIGILGFFILINIHPYQKDRFRCMLDPEFSKNDICYQVNQSLIAVGSGGFWGRGIGESRQKFWYLPEVSSDSIYAIIAEETGLFFGGAMIALFLTLFYRGIKIANRAPDGYGAILSVGIVSWIIIQALINIGGIINFIPMTGVPLPLVSYGGSAMLASLIALGILVNISKQVKKY